MVLTEPDRVVVGIIQDSDGRVLVARRPTTKVGGGLWEFPGGKVQGQESEREALGRELDEELGIVAEHCEPLPHFRASPPASVTLSFWRIHSYRGIPSGREGQAIRWCPIDELSGLPFLPADKPIFARLALPSLYLVSNVEALGEGLFEERLKNAFGGGARLLQLRELWPIERLRAYAKRLRALCDAYGAACLMNADPQEIPDCVDGVHLSSSRLWQLTVRPLPTGRLVAASCHNARDLEQAERIGCDFAVLSPVQRTASHPDAEPLGWSRFAELAASVSLPVYALGGLRVEDCPRAHLALAQGVALRSALFY